MKKQTKTIIATVLGVILITAGIGLYKLRKVDDRVQNFDKAPTEIIANDTINKDTFATDPPTNKPNLKPDINFPKTGNKPEDFVIAPYEIAMEDSGLLNADDYEDAVLVLTNKTDSTDLRPTLVLMGQADGSYQLYGVSWYTVGAAYINDGFQQYIQEDVEIDSAKLKVNLYGYGGPIGNQFNTYKFIDDKLVLINVNMYNAGAGGQTYIDVDYLKNMVRIEDVNTMKEDMPSEISHRKLPKHKPYFFETDEGLDFARH